MSNVIKIASKSISHGGKRPVGNIKYIVLHFTGNPTDTARGNGNYFSPRGDNARKAGAHYFVDDNDVVQSIADEYAAWAVGVFFTKANGAGSQWGKVTNYNSLSIEMCSRNKQITEKTVKRAAELTRELMKKYGIPADHVFRHWDVCGKECPGWNGWMGSNAPHWIKLKQMLQSNLSAAVVRYAVLTADANLRYKQGKDRPIIGTVKQGAKLQILRETGNWYQVAVWLPRKATKDGRVLADCNLRARAGKSQDVIGTYTAGKMINEQHHTDNWYQCAVWVPKKQCEKV